MIDQPARLAGIKVDHALVDRLVEDTDSGDALSLLAFTLAQLADGVGREGRLSAACYDQLGGVRGARPRQADQALAAATNITGRLPGGDRWAAAAGHRGRAGAAHPLAHPSR